MNGVSIFLNLPARVSLDVIYFHSTRSIDLVHLLNCNALVFVFAIDTSILKSSEIIHASKERMMLFIETEYMYRCSHSANT